MLLLLRERESVLTPPTAQQSSVAPGKASSRLPVSHRHARDPASPCENSSSGAGVLVVRIMRFWCLSSIGAVSTGCIRLMPA